MKVTVVVCLVFLVPSVALSNTCLLVDQLSGEEWAPQPGSVFPNSVCIYPDGRSGINDAVITVGGIGVELLFGALYAPFGGATGCDYQFLGKALDFGYSGPGVVMCGGGSQFAPCQSLPCSFNAFGIAGGGYTPVDANGQPHGKIMVIWVPDTCNHGCSQKYIELYVNSPDINGDLAVNATDLQLFVSDFYGTYNYRSDFNFDGVVSGVDLTIFSGGMGASCSSK